MATVKVPTMQELLEAGVHFGHQARRGNPKMKNYIYGVREGVHIVDLALSEEKLKEAALFAYKLGQEDKTLLLMGTKKQAQDIIKDLAKDTEMPFVATHWVGGLLTNFDEMRKNISKLSSLKTEKEKGTLSRYTKKEQLDISKKLAKFDDIYGGVATMTTLPDAIFVIDIVKEDVVVKEAKRLKIPVIGIADTNSNPDEIDFPIPGNDDGIKSIKIFAEAIVGAYKEGKKEAKVTADKKADEAKKAEEEKSLADSDIIEELEEKIEKEIVEKDTSKGGREEA